MLKVWNALSKRSIAEILGAKTEIQNNSDVPIFLIPIHCPYFLDARSEGLVDRSLAKEISPNGGSIKVDCSKYDNSGANSVSQIYILFRAGNSNELNEFLDNLERKFPKGIEVKKEEHLFHHSYLLGNRKLCLTRDTAGQISEVTNDSRVAPAEEVPSNLEDPKSKKKALQAEKAALEMKRNACLDEITKLEKQMKALQDKIATLNPDPSSTTNKASTS